MMKMMMSEEFHIILPSNNSMNLFSDNTTTHFTSYLPNQVNLDENNWVVGLVELQWPLKFQHISNDDEGLLKFHYKKPSEIDSLIESVYVNKGVYNSLSSLLEEINFKLNGNLIFAQSRSGYVTVKRGCVDSVCQKFEDIRFTLSEKLKNILGFEEKFYAVNAGETLCSENIANLGNALPNIALIYCNITEEVIVGDVRAKLLRAVPLNFDNFVYNSVRVKTFSPALYIPISTKSFRTLEIDIRDQYGKPLSFDSATLTVTLHFKKK